MAQPRSAAGDRGEISKRCGTSPCASGPGSVHPGHDVEGSERETGGPGPEDPDRAAVLRAAGGDRRAFEELVLRHQDRVYTRILFMIGDRELAADLAQEAFMKAYVGLGGFRGDARFATWLGRIAVNVTLHHIEKRSAHKRRGRVMSIDRPAGRDEDRGSFEIPDRTHLPDEWAVRNERQAAILGAVAELEPEYRSALALRELYGYSYKEIMEALNVPIGTVKSKIYRARQILQEKLKGIL